MLDVLVALGAFVIGVIYLLRRAQPVTWRTWVIIALYGCCIAYGYFSIN